MSNFAFVSDEFRDVAEAAMRAEGYIHSDPRSACFHARFAQQVRCRAHLAELDTLFASLQQGAFNGEL